MKATLTLALVLLLFVPACSRAETPPEAPKDTPVQEQAAQKTPTFSLDFSARFKEGPFSDAKLAFDERRWSDAADAFKVARETKDDPDAQLLQGLAALRAKRFTHAQATLSPLSKRDDYVLSAYASLFAAEAAAGAEDHQAAATLLHALLPAPELPIARKATLTLGLAELELQNLERGRALLEEVAKEKGALARKARLKLAQLDEGDDPSGSASAYKALIDTSPTSREGKKAREALDALLPKLSKEEQAQYQEDEEPFAAAKKLYDRHRSESAISAFEKLLKTTDKEEDKERWCEAKYLVAKSYSKLRKHEKAAPVYDSVMDHCEESQWHAKALYNAGRAHWNADDGTTAIERFEHLVEKHSALSLADDSLLYIARIQLEAKKDKQAKKTLRSQIEAYPDGDMAKDAHWLLFNLDYQAARYEEALAYANDHAEAAGEDDLYSKGRLSYFGARCLEHLDRPEEAKEALAGVVEKYPMMYYGLLAWRRLQSLDPALAAKMIDERWALTSQREQPEIPEALKDAPGLQRALGLLSLGLNDLAEEELNLLEGDLTWVRADLFDRSGDANRAHRIAAQQLLPPAHFPDGALRQRWQIAYPRPWYDWVSDAATKQEIPPHLIYSIMREESGFNPAVESWANARGLMQLMVETAKSTAPRAGIDDLDPDDLFLARIAIPIGAAYLSKLHASFGQHPIFTIAGYNGGQGNIRRWLKNNGSLPLDRWVEAIPYGQTRKYTKRVLTTYWRYQWLYAETPMVEFDPAEEAASAAKWSDD